MSEPFLGQIMIFAGNFAPRGWAFCDGRLLSIAQNTALFSILGTTYGGNGQTTFALPDLRGRLPVSAGQGPGLSNYQLGEMTGTENVSLTTTSMPAHTHPITATATPTVHASGRGDTDTVTDAVPGTASSGTPYAASPDGATTMNAGMVTVALSVQAGVSGGSQPFSVLQPLLALNFCIALEGIFPSRN
jgi:microcystin-dependent protein